MGKTNNVHTQLGHFHAAMEQVPLTGNPTPGPLKYRTKIMRWRRNCSSGSVEMTTDAHDLINLISSNRPVRGETVNVLISVVRNV